MVSTKSARPTSRDDQQPFSQRHAHACFPYRPREVFHRATVRIPSTPRDPKHNTNSKRNPLLNSRSILSYITPLLHADAKSYTTAEEFIDRNSTFFTTRISRPEYIPTSSPASSSSSSPDQAQVPLSALHTAAAALSLVPDSHWTIDTHRANIASYDGSAVIMSSSTSTTGTNTDDPEKSRIASDKRFKKELYHYLRWALLGGNPGPGIPDTMAILGRAESVRRLDEARRLTVIADVGAGDGQRRGKEEGKEQDDKDTAWMGSLASR